jgi:3-hydroxybutyryl-CoA dehydratase
MKAYVFEELYVGMSAEFHRDVNDELIHSFGKISGDLNLLHLDKDYARSAGYTDQVAHGMLCASFFSELVGVHLPGENCLLTDISVEFVNPVFTGDRVSISGAITQLSRAFKSVKIEATIMKKNSLVCVRAKIGVVVR